MPIRPTAGEAFPQAMNVHDANQFEIDIDAALAAFDWDRAETLAARYRAAAREETVKGGNGQSPWYRANYLFAKVALTAGRLEQTLQRTAPLLSRTPKPSTELECRVWLMAAEALARLHGGPQVHAHLARVPAALVSRKPLLRIQELRIRLWLGEVASLAEPLVGCAASLEHAGDAANLVRLTWMAAGVGGAVLAWWFVPTYQGPSLWSARREIARQEAELEALPLGNTTGLQRLDRSDARTLLLARFEQFRERIEEARLAWGRRSVDRSVADLEALPARDLAGFRQERDVRQELARLFRVLSSRIDAAEQAWGQRTAAAAAAETDVLLKNGFAQARARLQQVQGDLTELGIIEEAQAPLRDARRRVVRARLNGSRRETQKLVAAEHFQAAADAAQRLHTEWADEAKTVGMEHDLAQFHASCAFLAKLAQSAAKTDPKE